jgi:tryptophan synthase alpha chain
MTQRIQEHFRQLREDGRTALMPFLCAGHPTVDALPSTILAVEQAGAAAVEIGFPFSDPIADGPVIAAAMHEALGRGITPATIFEQIEAVRGRTSMGLVAMVSVTIIDRSGSEDFMRRAAEAGFDGLIVPDAPLEESSRLRAAARDHELTLTLLIAPTSPEPRAAAIARACTGFIYLLARTGITGEQSDAPEVADRVAMLRRHSDTPIACGFGISTAEHVRAVTQHADAAIVGSALVKRMGEAARAGDDPVEAARRFVQLLATGLVNHGAGGAKPA